MILQGVSSSMPDSNTSSWYNLALISDSASYSGSGHSYHMLLTGLDTDCQYEVRIRAMNSHGWSQLSEPFIFTTSSKYFFGCKCFIIPRTDLHCLGNCYFPNSISFYWSENCILSLSNYNRNSEVSISQIKDMLKLNHAIWDIFRVSEALRLCETFNHFFWDSLL